MLNANGPPVKLVSVTRRSIRAGSWYPEYSGPESCHGARSVWRTFCRPGTKFFEHYACRVTSFIGATNLSPVAKLFAGTGAVSRYKVERSQKFITVQDLNCVQMSVSGCNNHYKFILSAGTKAKSVTNNLPILSVLCLVLLFFNLDIPDYRAINICFVENQTVFVYRKVGSNY
jgi:hypothetical protein